LELTSNRCCRVASDFTNFTVHTAGCVRRAGESVTHIQRRRMTTDEQRTNFAPYLYFSINTIEIMYLAIV